MNKTDNADKIRATLTEQIIKHRPAKSEVEIDVEEWDRLYGRPWILPSKRAVRISISKSGNAYCRVCFEKKHHGLVLAYRLYIAYEDDPLEEFDKYINLTCHNPECGFELMVPMEKSDTKSFFDAERYKQMGRQMGKSSLSGAGYGAGPNAFQGGLTASEQMQRMQAQQNAIQREYLDKIAMSPQMQITAKPPTPEKGSMGEKIKAMLDNGFGTDDIKTMLGL